MAKPYWTGVHGLRYDPPAHTSAPVAQLDRVSVSEAEGHRFDPCRVRHPSKNTVKA